ELMDFLDRSPGQVRDFKKDDFEADWIKVTEGRCGQVYQVKLKLWREKCALKSFDTTCGNNFYRIIEEAPNIIRVKYKYIASIYGLCTEATAMVIEYMSNGSLNTLLADHTLMWPKKFQMIHEISMGMNFLHSMNPPLLHLNLKTSNILLDDHLHIKISDYGLIHWEEDMSKNMFMEILTARGSINYIPPETFSQWPDPPGVTFDIYSFGIVVWEILTQQKPYAGCTMTSVLLQVSQGKRPCLNMIPDERPDECDEMVNIMQQCWDQNQTKRPQFSGADIKKTNSFRQSVKTEHVHTQFSGEKSLLFYTVASGDAESVMHVLSLGADINSATSRGYTPLIIAVLHRLHDIISLLLEHGAATTQGDEDQWTALHFAAQNGDDRTVRLLLDKGAIPDAKEKSGWMPLHLACQNGHETVVRLLLSRLSEEAVGEREEAQGRTPLHLASAYGHVNIAKLLLSQGADPNSTDFFLATPLHLSAEEGHNRVVRQLVKSGVNIDSADSRGYTPLHLAALNGHTGICRQLFSNGASPDSRNHRGWTPMHSAVIRGHEATVIQLESLGGCVNATGEKGWTPLHLACHLNQPQVVANLLAAKANPNVAEDSEGWTPLHVACSSGSFSSVLHLISHHADVNAVNSSKTTPLHLAAMGSSVPIVKALLLNGADRTLLDSSGSTALNVAQSYEKLEIAQLLEKGC
uniref:Protein kinase domain-containing protein n=1 Tax=Monopterus albus TaxID=43700 RepID=A0A3Q3J059_MONAL